MTINDKILFVTAAGNSYFIKSAPSRRGNCA